MKEKKNSHEDLFSALYSIRFRVVRNLLKKAISGELGKADIKRVSLPDDYDVEVGYDILNDLKSNWALIDLDTYTTSIPEMPDLVLTKLEKRWLRTILDDPRIQLFGIDGNALKDVEPLFNRDNLVYFDKFTDGDAFNSPNYVKLFQTILEAFKNRRKVKVSYIANNGNHIEVLGIPIDLEYSEKNDRFRLNVDVESIYYTFNLSQIESCALGEYYDNIMRSYNPIEEAEIVVEDYNNAFERFVIHFSHYKKAVELMSENEEVRTFRVKLQYYKADEIELLIRILSFGKNVTVVKPVELRDKISERLKRQAEYLL